MRISRSKRWDSIVRSRVIVVECKGQAKASTTMPWGSQKRPWGDFDRELHEGIAVKEFAVDPKTREVKRGS